MVQNYSGYNGEAEKMLNKTEQIVHLQKENRETAVQEMLMGYRSTPHPATQTTPCEALMGRPVRSKLDHVKPQTTVTDKDKRVHERDKEYKDRLKKQKENRNTKSHDLVIGDILFYSNSTRRTNGQPHFNRQHSMLCTGFMDLQ